MTTSRDGASRDTLQETGAAAGRRKLWQLDSVCRESLIGLCLSPRELKELCRKLMIAAHPPEAEEFRRALIDVSGTPSRAARRLHKHLDRKYWRTVLRFTGATSTAALATLWQETPAGEAADAFWALATQPHASAWLLERVYREAHDRVRLPGGQALPVDDRTLSRLQRESAPCNGHQGTVESGITMRLYAIEQHSGRGTPSTPENADTSQQRSELQGMKSLLLSLRTQVEDYAAKLALERVRAERAEASAREWRQRAILYEERHRSRGATADPAARATRNLHGQRETLVTGRRLHVSGTD
jgi:hypothetical protein